ncbi:hypothetical protein EFK50_01410 [Nocardioides marmoriginsengisoli]|uniref:Uncharacterized protein n=1 Tax=Nocardioides marmoriginsengisoli TaxID=661483 RepID=A0A3N0CQK2_9ACTN|nr:hypothetical protein [Nocardioides marmoriginsengisoli]RNL65734.1 hypothetical protein EFK50_01410 [Nocardioides marmoriginsengisoli]
MSVVVQASLFGWGARLDCDACRGVWDLDEAYSNEDVRVAAELHDALCKPVGRVLGQALAEVGSA